MVVKRCTRQLVVEAARKHFSTSGYDGASMDGIASEAGVTKVTVYRHFGGKDSLFAAALQSLFDELPAPQKIVGEAQISLRAHLIEVARNVLVLGTGSHMAAIHRMLALLKDPANTSRATMWAANFQPYHEAVQQLLAAASRRKMLEIADIDAATTHFLSLAAGEPMVKLFLTGASRLDPAAEIKHISDAVDMFLRAYRISEPIGRRGSNAKSGH